MSEQAGPKVTLWNFGLTEIILSLLSLVYRYLKILLWTLFTQTDVGQTTVRLSDVRLNYAIMDCSHKL